MHKLFLLYSWFVWLMTFFMPDMKITMRFRGWLYFLPFRSSSKNIQVANSARLIGLENIKIGSDVYIASGVVINASAIVTIGSEVMIGHSAILVSGNHSLKADSYRFGSMVRKPILIGNGSWVGANVTILAGSIIPKATLIAANSVVTKALYEPGVYAGLPAKLIKKAI